MAINFVTERELTKKRRIGKLHRKIKEGMVGNFFIWEDYIKLKNKITPKDFEQYVFPYGRVKNFVYTQKDENTLLLYHKFKNTTKAKNFMKGVDDA